jgi:hypothetical protein
MPDTIIRYLRLYCSDPAAEPERGRDGVLAVAAVNDGCGLARLLLADMSAWGRNGGASVTNAIDRLVVVAHRHMVSGFGIALRDTQIVELNERGDFDLVCLQPDSQRCRHTPLSGRDKQITPRSREAFLSWAGAAGQDMLAKVEAVRDGAWAGAEG